MGKQGKGGRFVGSADFAPELAGERFWNRFDVLFRSSPTAADVNCVTLFDTGMGLAEVQKGDAEDQPLGKKWVVKGAVWAPLGNANVNGFVDFDTVISCTVTLTMPGVTHDAERIDQGILGRSMLMMHGEGVPVGDAMSGLIHFPLALDILSPIPVFSEQLAIHVVFGGTIGRFVDKAFCMSILYGWEPAYLADVLAARQAGL